MVARDLQPSDGKNRASLERETPYTASASQTGTFNRSGVPVQKNYNFQLIQQQGYYLFSIPTH